MAPIASRLAALACALPLAALAAFSMPQQGAVPAAAPLAASLRDEALAPALRIDLPALPKQAAAADSPPGAPLRVGTVRALPKALAVGAWTAVPGGYVTRIAATSEGAGGIRARLDLGTVPGPMQVRVRGGDARVEEMALDPWRGNVAWTPWTAGPTQAIEIYTPVLPGNAAAVSVGAVVDMDRGPFETKASAGACTLESMCAPDDPALPAGMAQAIAAASRASVRVNFIDGGSSFLCTATLVNTDRFPAPYLLTANHCIHDADAATTLTTVWFSESAMMCPDQAGNVPFSRQVAGGADLVFTNHNVDSSLLLMNAAAPDGAVYAALDASRLVPGEAIVSVSHPKGDTSRYAVGTFDALLRIDGYPQDHYGVRFSRGIIEAGSSGSGLFTLSGGELRLRGILTGTTVRQSGGMSCTDPDEDALYGRYEVFQPEVAQYLGTPRAADDAPNRARDLFAKAPDAADVLVPGAATRALDARRIDYAGDLDTYRFVLGTKAWVSAWSEGPNLDTVGAILDRKGANVEANDDAEASNNHFGITRQLGPGTYYLQVGHWDAAGTGAYDLSLRADAVGDNYTDLWWNPAESGWGLNVNHQGNVLFATLFTYDAGGAPMWLVMSDGEKQPDGAYAGPLYRATGPAFDAVPFGAVHLAAVGTMRLAFSGPDAGTLRYSYDGVTVEKPVTRQLFSTPPACSWSAFDRSYAFNYQDLWWNPAEPGWGVNVTHQGDVLFATLFTYDASGRGLWLVMSDGKRTGPGNYSGALYQLRGPAFDASPWGSVSLTQVGTMAFAFSGGNAGTMTYTVNGTHVVKSIQRQVFGALKTQCES